jgi:phosphatidylinositol phospholipase C beta
MFLSFFSFIYSARAQAKMSQYLVDVFGDMLITQPLKTHPIEDDCALPSPNDLKYKILIKNKKLHQSTNPKVNNNLPEQPPFRKTDSMATTVSEQSLSTCLTSASPPPSSYANQSTDSIRRKQSVLNEIRDGLQTIEFDPQLAGDNNRNGVLIEDDENSSDEEEISTTPGNGTETNDLNPTEILISDQTASMISNPTYPTNSDALAESKATKAMSDLVNYIVPVRFVTFTRAEERKRSYEISSFAEDKAQNLIRDSAKEFVAYNQRQLSRIYPRGTRFDSSNYNPYLFWPVGCQMVALNYQTMGKKKETYLFE